MITNRHNLTGRNQETNQPLSPTGGIPNQLKFQVPAFERIGETIQFGGQVQNFGLDWNEDQICWLEHPELGKAADVVALDVAYHWPKAPKPAFHVNDLPNSQPIVLQPALPVSVVGYPFGQVVGGHYPVWVSGSIASEPAIYADGKPALFIDCRTNKGSSGSPVFAYVTGGIAEVESEPSGSQHIMSTDDGHGRVAAMFHTSVQRFIGIYSGRLNSNSDIGLVWREEVIAAVCSHWKP